MKKENITQSDAVLLLLKYKPHINFSSLNDELPAYYRKDLSYAIEKMINLSLLIRSQQGKIADGWHYSLTKHGDKILRKRFAQLRHDDSTVNPLEGLVYAFGM